MSRAVFPILAAVILAALAFLAGRASGGTERIIVADTVRVAPPELERKIAALEIERDGLRARLDGVHRTGPRTVIVTDTVYRDLPTPRCVVSARSDGSGVLTVGRFDRVDSDTAGWAGSIDEGVNLGRCDDGWSIGPGGYTCDPARLGHLRLLLQGTAATSGVLGEAGLAWEPSYRSGTRVTLTRGTDGAWRAAISLSPKLPFP